MAELTQKEIIQEYLKCASSIEYFAEKYCTVWDKGAAKAVPFVLLPHQREVIKAYQNHNKNIILKYRQGGITTITCLFLAHTLCFTPSIKIAVVANQLTLARDSIFSQIVNMVKDLPDWLKVEPTNKSTQTFSWYSNGAQIMAVAAGKNGIRGFSPDIAFLDEAAYLQFGDSFFTALMGSLSAGGSVILNSTPNGMDSLYWKNYDDAINKRNNFNVVEIFWYQDPRFNKNLKFQKGEAFIEEWDWTKQAKLIEEGWEPTNDWLINICKGYNWDQKKIAQEVQGKFLGSGGNMIDERVITRIETDRKNGQRPPLCYFSPLTGDYTNIPESGCVWIWEKYVEGGVYILGADISSGRAEDFSTIELFRVHEGYKEQVAEFQFKVPPETMGDFIYMLGKEYGFPYMVMDVTGGYGTSAMARVLEHEYPMTRIHQSEIKSKPVRDRLQKYIKATRNGQELIPGFNIGANREMVLNELETRVRLEELLIHSSRIVSEFKTFVWNGQRFDHQRSAHDDLIFAAAMPLYAFAYSIGYNKKSVTKEKLLAMAKGWRSYNSMDRERLMMTPEEQKYQERKEQKRAENPNDFFSENKRVYRTPFQSF